VSTIRREDGRREDCFLFQPENIPRRARFPVIDAHNHLWGAWDQVEEFVSTFDDVGVVCYCDLTSNISIKWVEGGYEIAPGRIEDFIETCQGPYPNRFYGFSTATFCAPHDQPLYDDVDAFVDQTLELLESDIQKGARGLKILKEVGFLYRDASGRLINIDDEKLAPIWEAAGDLGVPVLIHQSDPYGFFQPLDEKNEHAFSLEKYSNWSFADSKYPRKEDLLKRRDNLLRNHRNTTFLLPHVANFPENLDEVARLLDENPNVYIDLSARMDELGRQPYSAREFILRYIDRIYFGTDMPPSRDMYRFHFRMFETFDEYFVPPDYDGTFGRHRWRVHGLGLPDDALKKIYHENALRLIPGLAGDLESIFPSGDAP